MGNLLLLIVVSACACSPGPRSRQEIETANVGTATEATGTTLRFTPMTGVDIIVILSQLERSYMNAHSVPLSVLFEAKSSHSTAGAFDINSSYVSLSAFASDMEGQDSAYKWTTSSISGQAYLVVKPVHNAYLDQTVVNFKYVNQTACYIINKLNNAADSRLSDTGGCMARRTPSTIAATAGADLVEQRISVSLSGTKTVEDVALAVLRELNEPVGFTVYEIDSSMQYFWEVTW